MSVPIHAFDLPATRTSNAASLANYEDVVGQWVFVWGDARYDAAIRSLIHSIDGACFEVIRIGRRAKELLTKGDTATAKRALRTVEPAQLSSPYAC
jgi:hypothetical protein